MGSKEPAGHDDDEVINAELAVWAARLEAEALEVREQSEHLSSSFSKQGNAIRDSVSQLKGEISRLRKSKLATSEVDDSMKAQLKVLQDEVIAKLDKLHSSTLKTADQSKAKAPQKLQAVLQAVNSLESICTTIESKQRSSDNELQQLNTTVAKCVRRIEDMHNIHVDLTRVIIDLQKNQNVLTDEIKSLSSRLNATRPLDPTSQFLKLTPDNSVHEHDIVQIPSRTLPKNPSRAVHKTNKAKAYVRPKSHNTRSKNSTSNTGSASLATTVQDFENQSKLANHNSWSNEIISLLSDTNEPPANNYFSSEI